MAFNQIPLVASDFSGLGQLQAGREAREQQAHQAELARQLAVQAQQQRAMEVAAARQQRAQEFAKQLALSQAAQQTQQEQFRWSMADAVAARAQAAAERAMQRADRERELREYQDFQRELNLGSGRPHIEALQRSDQLYRQLLGDIGSGNVRDIGTLNQRSTSDIDYGQHEQLMHALAAKQENLREASEKSEQAANVLNTMWESQKNLMKPKNPVDEENTFAMFLQNPSVRQRLGLVGYDETQHVFHPFTVRREEDAMNWREAAYGNPTPAPAPAPAPATLTATPAVAAPTAAAIAAPRMTVGPARWPASRPQPVPPAVPSADALKARVRQLVGQGLTLQQAAAQALAESRP